MRPAVRRSGRPAGLPLLAARGAAEPPDQRVQGRGPRVRDRGPRRQPDRPHGRGQRHRQPGAAADLGPRDYADVVQRWVDKINESGRRRGRVRPVVPARVRAGAGDRHDRHPLRRPAHVHRLRPSSSPSRSSRGRRSAPSSSPTTRGAPSSSSRRRTPSSGSRRSAGRRRTSAGPTSRRCRSARAPTSSWRSGARARSPTWWCSRRPPREATSPSPSCGRCRTASRRWPAAHSVAVRFDPPEPVEKLVRLTAFTEKGCTVTRRRGHRHRQARRLSRWRTTAITIRRQILDVELHGTESDGLALQRRLPRRVRRRAVAGPRGGVRAGRPGRRAPGRRTSRRSTCRTSPSTGSMPSWPTRCNGRSRTTSAAIRGAARPARPASEAGDVQRRTPAETVDEALVVFLRTGRLPWSFRVPPGSRLEQIVLDAWGAADADRGAAAGDAGASVGGARRPQRREPAWCMQFTPGFVATVLRGIVAAAGGRRRGGPGRARRDRRHPRAPGAAFSETGRGTPRSSPRRRGRQPGPGELARDGVAASSPIARARRPDARRGPRAALARRHRSTTTHHAAATDVEAPRPMPASPPVDLDEEPGGLLVDNAGVVLAPPVPAPLLRRARGRRRATSWSTPAARCACSTTSPPAS